MLFTIQSFSVMGFQAFFGVILALQGMPAFAGEAIDGKIKVRLSFWKQEGALPQPVGQVQELLLPTQNQTVNWPSNEVVPFAGKLGLFMVPNHQPPYIQLRWEWTGAADALCAHSVQFQQENWMPPLICAVRDPQSRVRWGVTLESWTLAQ